MAYRVHTVPDWFAVVYYFFYPVKCIYLDCYTSLADDPGFSEIEAMFYADALGVLLA